jgi:two-component system sensor histidine kinase EvgS
MAFTSKMVFQWNKYDHKILFMGVFMAIVMGILSQIFSIEAVRSNHLGYKCKYLAVIFLIFCNAANLLSGVVWFLMKQEVIMDTAYEYFTLSHIIYFNLYSIISLFSSLIITGDCVWAANKNQLIVEISAQLLLIVALTLIPGRTARIYAKETLYKMNEKLSFIRYISHEVRTPLNTAFLGLNHATIDVDGLQKKFPELLEIGAIRESLTDVHGACEVALSVINDLLTVDKLDSGKLTLQLEKINPIEFINDIFRSFKIVARQNDIVYTLDIDPSIRSWPIDRFISIDPYRFAQVIRNLISNAMKFTNAKGSVTIKVFMEQLPHSSQSADHSNLSSVVSVAPDIISLREGQLQRLRIEVVDTGAGISLENQKQLFTEYTQFHANRLQQGGGSGLGLWITKGIFLLHNE